MVCKGKHIKCKYNYGFESKYCVIYNVFVLPTWEAGKEAYSLCQYILYVYVYVQWLKAASISLHHVALPEYEYMDSLSQNTAFDCTVEMF